MKFRYVDRILSWSAHRSIRGVKAVSFEEYTLKQPFGGEPALPETLLLESFLQLGNWLILLSTDFAQCGVVIRISEVRFASRLGPGEAVEMQVNVVRRRGDAWELEGEGRVGDRLVISGLGCLAATVPTTEVFDPEDLRVLFSEIHQPPRGIDA